MKGFIVYPTYRQTEENALIYLFGRLENGESFLTINSFKPYFFIKKSDLKHALEIEKFENEETEFKDFDENPVVKIVLDFPAQVPKLREKLENKGIECYEADIRFAYRFLIDNNLKGSVEIEGDYKKGDFIDRIYEEPGLKPSDYFPELVLLSLDVETDSKAKEIYCVSLYTKNYEKVIIRSKEKLKNAISVDSEKELLEKFKEIVLKIDPDIITGWNVIDFDLKIIRDKFKHYKIPFNLGRDDTECSLKVFDNFMRDSKADFPGRMVLDGIPFLKTSFVRLDDYSLDNVSQVLLNEKKSIDKKEKGEKIEEYFRKEPQLLIDYNLKDSELVYRILAEKKIIELTIQRSLLTGMQLDRVKASIASLDSLYIRETRKKGYVCPNSKFNEKEEQIKGGFVRESIPGIYDFVIVLDFKSLYPSIIKTFNIDPFSFIKKGKDREKEEKNEEEAEKIKDSDIKSEKFIQAPNGAIFRNDDGILPVLIRILWEQRENAKKEKNKEASYAIKILMNSFFGVLANPTCRFFSLDMANAITSFGQYIIKLTAKKIEEMGYQVIYSDTDSAFVNSNARLLKEAEITGEKIQNYINDFYKNFVKEEYQRESFLELQFEKVFIRFLMPKIRGSEIGAKKRYAGLVINKENKEEIVFTGLEAIRSDWTELSKIFQNELLEKIFHKQDVVPFIKTFVKDIKSGKHDNLLIYRKKINKPLEEYVKTTPPHVKAARKLNKIRSNLIQYVMTTDGPEPIEDVRNKIDYDHYIEKQIKPIADSLLNFIGKSFDEILGDDKQMNLSGFN